VLIIIFMVITPLTPTGLRTLLPQPPSERPEQPRADIVISVAKDGVVMLNGERSSLLALPDRLARIFQARGDGVIFVRGDRDLEFSKIAEVIDIAKGAGLQRLALLTQ
jgi:biopolymer transport protein TolR